MACLAVNDDGLGRCRLGAQLCGLSLSVFFGGFSIECSAQRLFGRHLGVLLDAGDFLWRALGGSSWASKGDCFGLYPWGIGVGVGGVEPFGGSALCAHGYDRIG